MRLPCVPPVHNRLRPAAGQLRYERAETGGNHGEYDAERRFRSFVLGTVGTDGLAADAFLPHHLERLAEHQSGQRGHDGLENLIAKLIGIIQSLVAHRIHLLVDGVQGRHHAVRTGFHIRHFTHETSVTRRKTCRNMCGTRGGMG